jgi:RNA polymerase sigma factor (sigma-70 family)
MESSAGQVPLERLLAHREWVRRMARVLVRDPNEADDLEQDVWVAALERPPRSARGLRGWFAAALRHDLIDARRSQAGRTRREESHAREIAVPAPDELVAEAEAHRRVVVAVMELPEPYRSTILYRFFEDLAPGELASRTGVPLETVRTRLRRALAMLRERFEAEHGGVRGAMLPLLAARTAAPAAPKQGNALPGDRTMNASTPVTVVSVIAIACAVAWWAMPAATPSHEESGTPAAAVPQREPPRRPPPTLRTHAAIESSDVAAAIAPVAPPLAAAAAPAPAPQPDPPPTEPAKPAAPAGEIAGRVLLLADRSPVPNAVVSLKMESAAADAKPPEIAPVTTGTTGEFRFRGVPAGSYLLRAVRQGFSDRILSGVRVTQTSGVDGVELLLAVGGTIEGGVVDAAGAGVAGLPVSTQWAGPPSGSASVRTDEDGKFRFDHVPPGTHSVRVERGAGEALTAFVEVTEAETARADFRAAASLTGILLDETSVPLAGAIVRAGSSASGRYVSRQAKTDEAGRFRVEGLEPGKWNVGVQVVGAGAFAADLLEVDLTWGAQDVTLRVPPGSFGGRLLTAARTPLSGRAVQLSLSVLTRKEDGTWALGGPAGMAFAAADGSYRFRGLATGRYRLFAYPHDKSLRAFEKDVDVGSSAAPDVEIVLESGRTGTARITVRDLDGKPLEGVRFTTIDHHGDVSTATTLHVESGEPGVYVALLEAGARRIGLSRADLLPGETTVDVVESRTVEASVVLRWGGNDVQAHAASGEIAGRLVVRGTSKPLTAKEVQLSIYSVSPWNFVALAQAREDGQFRFRGIAPGRYRVLAHPTRPVYRPLEVDVELGKSGNREGLELAFEPCTCGKVKFVVVDDVGEPVEGALFSIVTKDSPGHTSSTTFAARAGAPGEYVAELETGPRKVHVLREGYASATATVTVKENGTADVKVTLRKAR